jgi:uncharacterized protein YndB with AHSA1/START domain
MPARSLELVADPGKPTIVMTRMFDAPSRLVFDAHTRREHLIRWWTGCDEMTMAVCEVDLRVGGAYRFVLRMPHGQESGFHGSYREIVPSTRLVTTLVYEPVPDSEAIVTLVLEEHDGRTKLTSTTLHPTMAARDAHVASGMETGAAQSLNRLEALLRTLEEAR